MKKLNYVKIGIYLFLFITIILPLLKMFTTLTTVNFGEIIGTDLFQSSLVNSLIVTVAASIFSVLLALLMAYLLNRSTVRYKYLITMLLTLPMLIPSISHGMGLIILLGENGILTKILNVNFHIYGFFGIFLGSVLYSFPIAFLLLKDVFQYESKECYVAADILGIPKTSQFKKIWLKSFMKPLIAIFFAIFALIFTDYGVPMMVGGRFSTLPIYMYNEVVGQADFGKGSFIGLILLMPAVLSSIFDLFNKNAVSSDTIECIYNYKKKKVINGFCYFACTLMGIIILMPILAFVLITFFKKYPHDLSLTFDHIKKVFEMNLFKYIMNSLLIAVFVSLLGTFISFITSYITARSEDKDKKILHFISLISLAIPGLVLGISYSMFFSGSIIYSTIVILVLVNISHFFSSPYLMCYNALCKINQNYEITAKTLNIPKFYLIKDVIVKESRGTILEMFSYLFINSMITISAVSFLVNVDNLTLSLLIPQFEAQSLLEASAFVSLVILFINLIVKLSVYYFRRRLR